MATRDDVWRSAGLEGQVLVVSKRPDGCYELEVRNSGDGYRRCAFTLSPSDLAGLNDWTWEQGITLDDDDLSVTVVDDDQDPADGDDDGEGDLPWVDVLVPAEVAALVTWYGVG